MAEKQEDILLNYALKDNEIFIAFELAVALRADEVEKFLELYDSIPKTVETERVVEIKEMARQLAAFPKKQFDMYRTKPRGLVSGELFTISPPTLNNKDKLLPDRVDNTTSSKPRDLDIKDIILDISKNSIDMDQVNVIPNKSTKKKSKKKKKKATAPTDQTSSICNVELPPASEREKDSNLSIENKLLDSNGSCSRVVTMNKTMVADISVLPAASTTKITDSTIDHSGYDAKDINNADENQLENKGTEDKKYTDAKDLNELHSVNHHTAPPFGYPLSTDKLIQSAIELLACEPSKDLNTTDQKPNYNETDSSSVSVNSPIEIEISVDGNDSLKDAASPPELKNLELKNGGNKIDESIDGDISNLSAWEDEGWQSQGRRSHRKKKKEFAARERSNSNQKNKRDAPEENKQNNFKRQNPRNAHNRKIGTKLNSSHEVKNTSMQAGVKDGDNEKNGSEIENAKYVDKDNKEIINSEVEVKAVFSYRDALLKAKPKNTDELQYNSDSGVDVNSVGSCDSAIHSPKLANEFDLEEAVNFFTKGWDEVMELHKQGKVVYYSDNPNPLPTNRSKKPFKKYWHPRPKHHK